MINGRSREAESPFPINLPQTPGEYLDILRFRWYWIAIGLVLGAVGSQIAVRSVPKQYVSRTVVLVENDKIPERYLPRITNEQAQDRLRTIHEEILARATIERILDDLNPYPELQDMPRGQIVEMIRGRAGIGLRGREAFVVEYRDTDPERAQQMAARLASLFIEQTSGERSAQALDANQFIEARLDETRRDLESVESRLSDIKTRNMGMLPGQLNANLATLQRLELQRQSMQTQIRGAIDRRMLIARQLTLESQMSEPEAQLIPAFPTAGTQPSATPSTLGALTEYLAQLRTRYTDEHPEVQATIARITRLEEAASAAELEPPLLSEDNDVAQDAPTPSVEPQSLSVDIMVTDLRAQLAAANNDIRLMQEEYAGVQRKIAEYQARVERIPEVEQELQALERDYRLMSNYYGELMSRKLQAETAGAVERKWQEQFTIIDPAQLPRSATSPDASLFLLAGTAIGLGAGLLGAFLLEVLDPSVKSLRQLESLLPYPVLLTLPQVKLQTSRRKSPREPTPPAPPSERQTENELSAAS